MWVLCGCELTEEMFYSDLYECSLGIGNENVVFCTKDVKWLEQKIY